MATDGTTAAFNEVVFRGKPKVVRAFLSGLLLGAGRQAQVYYSFLEGVKHEGRTEKLAEMVGVRDSDCHVIADAATAGWLKGLARQITAETGLEITANRRIRGAAMELRYHAYAQRYEDEILAALGDLPAGVRIAGMKREVRTDPRAKGIEAYSPAHEFEAKASGTMTGPIEALIVLRRRLVAYPLLKMSEIELKTS
ncbi:MAG: hypothetical protein IPK64_05995 [bacterium]|nr:hypothetical protein [bacterium]